VIHTPGLTVFLSTQYLHVKRGVRGGILHYKSGRGQPVGGLAVMGKITRVLVWSTLLVLQQNLDVRRYGIFQPVRPTDRESKSGVHKSRGISS
jgi:hypothetical protein